MTINIITAFTYKRFGIGKDGILSWNLPEDLKRFSNLTNDCVVVMGRKTWDSIPDHKKPLKNRVNIVITSQSHDITNNNLFFIRIDDLNTYIEKYKDREIFIIGGTSLYKQYMGIVDRIYATIIEKEFDSDTFFPIDNFHMYEIEEYSEQKQYDDIKYRFITYKKTDKVHDEFVYMNLIQDIMKNGNERPDRTGVGTKSVFGRQLRFSIEHSIPLITTKFVGIKSILAELLWFLRGETDSKILEKQNVNIWRANSSREFLDKRGLQHYEVGDIGPMYGRIWRSFNSEYKGCSNNYKGQGFDQLEALIKGLKEDPYSRRHLLTTFNPTVLDQSVLMPCHGIGISFYCEKVNEQMYLSCHMFQRSVDVALGLPYNIASYAILTYIIAKKCNMYPKDLIISCSDTHIYNNVYEQLNLQLTRSPLPFPILHVDDSVKYTEFDDISQDQFKLVGYLHYPSIKMEMAV